MFNRILTYVTVMACLVVGSLAYKIASPNAVVVTVDASILSVFKPAPIDSFTEIEITSPEVAFEEIKIPDVKVVRPVVVKAKTNIIPVIVSTPPRVIVKSISNELPFHEAVVLSPIRFEGSLLKNVASLYKDVSAEETLIAEVQSDEVKTIQASVIEEEIPDAVFFDYEEENKVVEVKEPVVKEVAPEITNTVQATPTEIMPVVADGEEVKLDEVLNLDYPAPTAAVAVAAPVKEVASVPVTTQPVAVQAPVIQMNYAEGEEVKIDDVVSFNHVAATKAVTTQAIPTVAKSVIAQKPADPVSTQVNAYMAEENFTNTRKTLAKSFPARISIQVNEANLVGTKSLNNFEVRFQDDLSASHGDFGSGEVTLDEELSQDKMTRSISILKQGLVPTNTDLILEDGASSLSIPMLSEELYNNISEKFEERGPIGALLVELDDATELAQLDVPFGKVIKLDGDLKKTTTDDFRYQLFVGVRAGNALLSYKKSDGQRVSKIIHLHERELTFESNFFEEVNSAKVKLFEEDLLSKEQTPLRIAADQVKVFATDKTSKKINDHTHKINFGSTLLATRRYLELNHQSEPIFVGLRSNNSVSIPSENFMRFILSNFEGSKLGNRCLVQVNLTKRVVKVDIGSESVGSGLMTLTQMLDADGKFYDSAGEKTRKVIIVGENQGSEEYSQDAKINIKIDYLDGTTDFVNSYCSPNSYLVEQL